MIQVVIWEKWAKENFSFAAKRLMEREPYCTLCFGATLASPHHTGLTQPVVGISICERKP